MIYNLGELFSGPGGLAYGAITADIGDPNFKIVHAWANDYDDSTCRTYRRNICKNDDDDSVYCGDVRKLDISDKNPLFSKHPFNAFAFGFPCNDFSTVGEQKGFDGTYGPLYTYGVKVLNKFEPDWFLAENVSGLSSANDGGAFPKILHDLHKCGKHGYRLYPHLYKFEEYGVPQARHRIVIIGIRKDQNVVYKVPATSRFEKRTCRDAIENPMIREDAFNNEKTKQSPSVVERLKYIQPGQNAFTADIPEELQLNVKGAKISQIYRRLDPDKPAYTVTGSGGGGTHVYHWR